MKLTTQLTFLMMIVLVLVGCNPKMKTKEEKAKVTSSLGNFEGCLKVTATGSSSVDLVFQIPKDTSVFYVYRDGIPVKTIANLTMTTISDNENLRPGQTYNYSCWAKIGAQLYQGTTILEVTLPAAEYPNFKGAISVEETSSSIAKTATNDKQVRVTWEPELENGPRAYKYKIYAFYGEKAETDIDWTKLPTPKAEAKWPATFLNVKVGEDMPYTFLVRACTKEVGDVREYCDVNKAIIVPKRASGIKRISDGGSPTTFSSTDLMLTASQVDGKVILDIPWNDNLGGVLKREVIRNEYNKAGSVVDTRVEIKTTGIGSTFMKNPVPITSYVDGDDVGEIKPFTKYTYQVFDYDFSDLTKKTASNLLTITTTDLTPPTYTGLSSIEFKPGFEDTSVVLKFPKTLSEKVDVELGASYYLIYKSHTSTPYEAITNPCDAAGSSSVELTTVAIDDSKIIYDASSDKDTYIFNGLESRNQYAFCVKTQDTTGNISKGVIYRGGSGTSLAINEHRVVMRDRQSPYFDGVESVEIVNGKVKLSWATPSNGKGGAAPDLGRYLIRFRNGATIEDADFKSKVTAVREQEILNTNTANNISVTIDRSQQAPKCYQTATPSVSGSCEMFKDRENLIVSVDICDDAGDSGGITSGAMNFAKHDFSVAQDGNSNCTDSYSKLKSLKLGSNFLVINDITAPWPWYGISSAIAVSSLDGALDVSFDVPKGKKDRDDFGYFKLYRIINPTLDADKGLDLLVNKEALSDPVKCEDITNCLTKDDPANVNSDYTYDKLTHRFLGLDARRSYTFYLSAIDKELPTYNERFINISPGVNTKEVKTADVTAPYWNGRKRTDDLHDPSFSKSYDKGNIELSFNCIDDNQYKYEPNTNLNYNVYLFRVKKDSTTYYSTADFESKVYDGVNFAKFAATPTTDVNSKINGVSYFSMLGQGGNSAVGIELFQVNNKPEDEIKYSPLTSYSGNSTTVKSTCSFNPETNTVTGRITYTYKVTTYDENKNLLFAVCANDASSNFRCGSVVVGQEISDTIPPTLSSIEAVYSNENLPSPASEDSMSSIVRRWKLKLKALDSSSVSISVYRAFSDSNDRVIDYPSVGNLSVNDAVQVGAFSQSNIPVDPSFFETAGFDSTANYTLGTGGKVENRVYANYLIVLTDLAGNETRKFYSVLAHYPVEVVSGDNHTCTLFNSGKIQCWGENKFGQIGYPYLPDNTTLAASHDYGYVQLGGKAKQIVAGSHHNCALMEDDTVRCWGSGVFGQLGNKRSGNANTIGKNEFPYQKQAVTITSAGNTHTVVKLFAWGTQATCAQVHNTGSGSEWKLYCWGATYVPNGTTSSAVASNYSGYLLGNSFNNSILNTPQEIVKPVNMGKIQSMYGSARGTCFVADYSPSGTNIACSGYNTGPQDTLAMGTTHLGVPVYYSTPYPTFTSIAGTSSLLNTLTRVSGANGTLTSVHLGELHACALFDNGGKKFRCWGLNQNGLLGNNILTSSNYSSFATTYLGWSTVHPNGNVVGNFNTFNSNGSLPLTINLLASKVDDLSASWGKAQTYSGTSEVANFYAGNDVNCITSNQGKLKCWGGTISRTGMPSGFGSTYLVGTSNQAVNNSSSYWNYTTPAGDLSYYYNHCAASAMFPVNSPILYSQSLADSDADYKKCFSPNQPSGSVYNVEEAPYEVAINSGSQQDKVYSVSIGKYNNCAILNHGDLKCWGGTGVSVDSKLSGFKLAKDHKPVFDSLDTTDIDVTIAAQSNWYEFFLVPGRDTDNQNIAAKIQDLPGQGSLQCQKNGEYVNVAIGDEILSPYKCRYKVDIDLGTLFSSDNGFTYKLIQLSQSNIDYSNESYSLVPSQNILNTTKKVNFKNVVLDTSNLYRGTYKILQVTTGSSHTCVLYETIISPIYTGVKCWGNNNYGQLGFGNNVNVGSDSVTSNKFTYSHSDFGTQDNVANGEKVVSSLVTGNWFKLNEFGDVPIFWSPDSSSLITTRIRKVVAGTNHTCAMADDAANPGKYQAKCWGSNSKGQLLGFINTSDSIGDFERGDYPLNKGRSLVVKDIYAFGNSTCVVQETTGTIKNDKIVCFGDMSIGALKEVSGGHISISGTVKKIALGSNHICFLNSAGSVRCMGDDSYGQLGKGILAGNPELINFPDSGMSGLSNIQDIIAGSNFNCVLGSDAQVACWGGALTSLGSSIDYATSGNSTGSYMSKSNGWFSPSTDKKVTSLVGTTNRACALLAGGGMKCWGDNAGYSLMYRSVDFGSSDPVIQYPELMSDIKALKDSAGGIASGDGIIQVSLGGNFSCYLTSRNNLNCAGSNQNGQQAYYETGPLAINYNRLSKNIGDIFVARVNHTPFYKQLEKPDFKIISVKGLERKIKLVQAWDLDWDDNNTLSYTLDLPGEGDPTKTIVEQSLSKCFHLNPDQGVKDIECDFKYLGGATGDDTALLTYFAIDGKSPPAKISKNIYITFRNDEPLYYESVISGESHTCAYMNNANKDLYCWGYNGYGQLGYGHTISSNPNTNNGNFAYGAVPVLSDAEKSLYPNYKIEDIALGKDHTCTLVRLTGSRLINGGDARVRCWGKNNVGQLGQDFSTGTKTLESVGDNEFAFNAGWIDFSKTKVRTGSGSSIYTSFKPMRLEAAGDKTCALGVVTDNSVNYRSIVCWGTNRNTWEPVWDSTNKTIRFSNPTYEAYVSTDNSLRAVDFSMSKEHLCLIEEKISDRKVKCLGYNEHGALGVDKSTSDRLFLAALTTDYTGSIDPVQLFTTSSEKIKLNFSSEDSTARASTESTKDYYMAQRGSLIVAAPPKQTGSNPIVIDRQSFACVLLDAFGTEREDGYVKCWGTKEFVGHVLTGSSDISSGSSTNSTIKNNKYVQLGDAGSVETAAYLPRTLSIPCALRKDGLIQCWNGASSTSSGVGASFWPEVLGVRIMNFSIGSTSIGATLPTNSSVDACYVLDNYEMTCTGASKGNQEYSPTKSYCKLSDTDCKNSANGSLTSVNSKVAVNKSSLRTNHTPYFYNTNDYKKVYSPSGNINGVSFIIGSGSDYDLDDQVKVVINLESKDGCLQFLNINPNQFYNVTNFPKYIKARVKTPAEDSSCVTTSTYQARLRIVDNDDNSAFEEKIITIDAFSKKIKKVALGEAHSCVLIESTVKTENYVKCWGRNDYYQTGIAGSAGGNLKNISTPLNDAGNTMSALVDLPMNLGNVQIKKTSETNLYVDNIFAGGNRTCALLKNINDSDYSGLRCWGYVDTPAPLGTTFYSRKSTYPFYYAQTFNAIDTINNLFENIKETVAAATTPGTYASLGYGTVDSSSIMLPTRIKDAGDIQITTDNNIFIKSVQVGHASVCVHYTNRTLGDDEVKCFGSNQDGRLGKGVLAANSPEFADSTDFVSANPMTLNINMNSPGVLYTGAPNNTGYYGSYYPLAQSCSFTNAKKINDPRSGLVSDRPRKKYSISISNFTFDATNRVSVNRNYPLRCIPSTEDCANHSVSNETAGENDGTMSKLCFLDNYTDPVNPEWKTFDSSNFNFLSVYGYSGATLQSNYTTISDVDSTYSDYSLYVRKPSEMSATITTLEDDQISSNGATLLGADAYTCLNMPNASGSGAVKNYCWGKLKAGAAGYYNSSSPAQNTFLSDIGSYDKLAITNGALCYVVPTSFNQVQCKGTFNNYVEISSDYEYRNPRLLTASCGVFTEGGKDTVKCWGRQNAYFSTSSSSYHSTNSASSACGSGCMMNFYNNLGFSSFDRSWNQVAELDYYGSAAKEVRGGVNVDSDLYIDIADKLKAATYSSEVDNKLAKYSPNVDLFIDENESVTNIVTNPTNQFHCAVVDQIKLRCWGLNSFGQLGYGKYFADDAATRILSPAQRGDVPLFKSGD